MSMNAHHLKSLQNNKCWGEHGAKTSLLHCWCECKLLHPLWKTVQRFLLKLKVELPYDPAVSLRGLYPDKTMIKKVTCTPMFIETLQ